MSLDAMKQALEALEFLALENFVELDKSLNVGPTHGRKAIIALRAAIEQAEMQEPVAWGVFDGPNLHDVNFTEEDAQEMVRLKGDGSVVKPLYTSTQPQMQPCAGRNCGSTNPNLHSAECFEDYEKATGMNHWQGLTDDEIKEIIGPWGETPIKGYTRKLFDQIEAKLKEKNT